MTNTLAKEAPMEADIKEIRSDLRQAISHFLQVEQRLNGWMGQHTAAAPSQEHSAASSVLEPPKRFSINTQQEEEVKVPQRVSEQSTPRTDEALRDDAPGKPLSRKDDGEDISACVVLLVRSRFFEGFSILMIVANSIILGVEVEMASKGHKAEETFRALSIGFTIWFCLEVVFRACAAGSLQDYLTNADYEWNCFDLGCCIASVIDVSLDVIIAAAKLEESPAFNTNLLRLGRIARLARIVRIFRVVRFLWELQLLVACIFNSMKSLLWTLILLFMFLYAFSIYLTQGTIDYLASGRGLPGESMTVLTQRYGSLWNSIFSLYQGLTNGVEWGQEYELFVQVHWIYECSYALFMTFCLLAVMNVVTAVFVEGAMERAREERDFQIKKQLESTQKFMKDLEALFLELDSDGSGAVTREEFKECIGDERIQRYFQKLDLDLNEKLFDVLDMDNNGFVLIDEFLESCMKFRNETKVADIVSLQKHVNVKIAGLMSAWNMMEKAMEEHIDRLGNVLEVKFYNLERQLHQQVGESVSSSIARGLSSNSLSRPPSQDSEPDGVNHHEHKVGAGRHHGQVGAGRPHEQQSEKVGAGRRHDQDDDRIVGGLQQIFHRADVGDAGELPWKRLQDHLKDSTVQAFLKTLNLEAWDLRAFFRPPNRWEDVSISVDQFVNACLRMTGEAKSVDVMVMRHELAILSEQFSTFSTLSENAHRMQLASIDTLQKSLKGVDLYEEDEPPAAMPPQGLGQRSDPGSWGAARPLLAAPSPQGGRSPGSGNEGHFF